MKLFYDIAGTQVDQVPSSSPLMVVSHKIFLKSNSFDVKSVAKVSSVWNVCHPVIQVSKCVKTGLFACASQFLGDFVLIVSHGQFTTTHLVRSTNTCNTISNNSRYTMCVTHATQFWSTSTTHPTKVQILHSFIARYQQPGNLFEETRLEAFSFWKGRRWLLLADAYSVISAQEWK